MGKRKERRLAAKSNAGRRVKLDLFAEPSGDLGGSSVHEEVGGEIDPTQSAGLPESPSSSGQQQQNPLLLLGQYSDDELDDESSKPIDPTVKDNLPSGGKEQEVPHNEGKSVESNAVEDNSTQTFQQKEKERASSLVGALQSPEDVNSRENLGMHSVDTSSEMASAEQVPASGISDARDLGDMSFGWRLVMHEESNRYYYWNTETGETSWEVPDVLAQTVQSTSDYRSTVTEHAETAPVGTHESTSYMGVDLGTSSNALTKDGSTCTDLVHQSKGVDQNGPQMDVFSQQDQDGLVEDKLCRNDVGQSGLQSSTSPVNDAATVSGCALAMDVDKRGKELPNGLMKQCECLLERVKSLKGYDDCLQIQNRMSKYILEVEVRLSDIRSLSSYGSSLLPYWTYSETQLKQLEDAINNEIYQLAVSAQMDDDVKVVIDSSCKEREESEENLGHKSEADAPVSVRESVSPVSTYDEHITNKETVSGDDLYTQQLASTGSHTRQMGSEARSSEELYATDHVKPEFHSGDVDMDVDMEVEDDVPVAFTTLRDTSGSMEFGAVEPLGQSHPPSDYSSFMSGEASSIPPPPEEEWIPPPPPDNEPVPPPPPDNEPVPPPPPDNEQVPPPPPDDHPESSYSQLPSYGETSQSIAYSDQYSLMYPGSNFQYYGHAVAVPSSNFYAQSDASQGSLPSATLYYEPVPNTYVDSASVIVNPADQVPYYTVQDGSLPPVPGVSGTNSSQLNIESGVVSYDALALEKMGTADGSIPAAPAVKLNVSALAVETDTPSLEFPSTSTTIEAPPTTSEESSVTAPSTNAVASSAAILAPFTASKVQSKVLRSKKRTVAAAPSLRSNKKVSSLVDKWKAAKEELKEDEEHERESAYDMLEKKRQREIEEWRAKQIASGEAKDNANFQPLGGDWRERVKRKRAEAAKEASRTSPEASAIENQQQPDLVEFSKGLPSGWQAYWDDASKQVYYGNVNTSETTWTRPTT